METDFYPAIKGYYIKDRESNYYMLLSIQKYDSQDFSGLRLLKYKQPGFTFPHQDNYIKKNKNKEPRHKTQ
ncbi:hypothetical protein [Chryseobacterium sp. SL1]|uniref:hypothetical protein n=1 Tax=Chryseobacterium sp. SL1 TaxID=2995159 RepID=UPI00227CA6AB|nr:hypothetical protein [Chryseobacterium sp. SL1]